MKLLSNKTLLVLLVIFSGFGYVISCTRDNSTIVPIVLTPPFVPTRGTNVHLPGNMTKGNANEWKFDKTHSSVLWTTSYKDAAGLLTGRFNQFGLHDVTDAKAIKYSVPQNVQPLADSSWAFYENQPEKTYFNGYVQINTSNTGEPGRDTGCNIAGMGGTTAVKIISGTQNLTYPNLAKITTTKVVFDPASNGYIVTLSLTYQGKLAAPLTKTGIIGKLNYIPRGTVLGGTPGGNQDAFGLQLKFSFNCRDFGIDSKSVADKIEIECNINFNNV